MSTLEINIDTATTKWKAAFPKQRKKMEAAAALAYLLAKKPAALKGQDVSLTVTLTSNAAIRKLNRDYRAKDMATNVLSFPQIAMPTPGRAAKARGKHKQAAPLKKSDLRVFSQRTLPLGDVVMAFETIKKEAKEQKKTVESHTLHLIIHGVLHLLGYDHMSDAEAKHMEKLECDILAMMGYPDPYHVPRDSKKAG